MDILSAKEYVKEQLSEYISLSKGNLPIDLGDLSDSVNQCINHLESEGVVMYEDFGRQVKSVNLYSNEFGVIFIKFNEVGRGA